MVVAPKRSRLSIVWIIPVLAALVAIGIAVQRIRSEGPTITIVFRAAEGIEAGKTFIKYKDVNIGQVTDGAVSPRITRRSRSRPRSPSARPGPDGRGCEVLGGAPERSACSGISGLNTLLSGNYIGFEAGTSEDERAQLHRARQGAVRREPAGTTSSCSRPTTSARSRWARRSITGACRWARSSPTTSPPDGKSVEIQVFVNAPYDKYVSPGTRFWKASGFDVTFDANGLDIRTESLVGAAGRRPRRSTPPPFVHDTTARRRTRSSRSTPIAPPR